VINAVSAGKFRIYAVRSIDEGIEVLTGTAAGERKNGKPYPDGTVNHLVEKRLKEFAEGLLKFGKEEESPKRVSGKRGKK
jgi:hypothetical protein